MHTINSGSFKISKHRHFHTAFYIIAKRIQKLCRTIWKHSEKFFSMRVVLLQEIWIVLRKKTEQVFNLGTLIFRQSKRLWTVTWGCLKPNSTDPSAEDSLVHLMYSLTSPISFLGAQSDSLKLMTVWGTAGKRMH